MSFITFCGGSAAITSSSVVRRHGSVKKSVTNGSDGRISLRNPKQQSINDILSHGDISTQQRFLIEWVHIFNVLLNNYFSYRVNQATITTKLPSITHAASTASNTLDDYLDSIGCTLAANRFTSPTSGESNHNQFSLINSDSDYTGSLTWSALWCSLLLACTSDMLCNYITHTCLNRQQKQTNKKNDKICRSQFPFEFPYSRLILVLRLCVCVCVCLYLWSL